MGKGDEVIVKIVKGDDGKMNLGLGLNFIFL